MGRTDADRMGEIFIPGPAGWPDSSAWSPVAPPSAVLTVLSGPSTTPAAWSTGGTTTSAEVDTAMRFGAGHPADPFDVLAARPEQERTRSSVALPPADAGTVPLVDGIGPWAGPVRVVDTGHMTTGIVEAVPEDRDVKAGVVVRLDVSLSASGPLATKTSSVCVSDL